MWEAELEGPAGGNPYTEVTFTATFTQGERSLDAPGFWDGGGTYRLRFSPPTEGEWDSVTRSNRPELDGKRGTLTAVAPTGNNHGPVVVVNNFYLCYADGRLRLAVNQWPDGAEDIVPGGRSAACPRLLAMAPSGPSFISAPQQIRR